MMRVLHVVPDLVPYGLENMVASLLRSLDRSRFQTGVVSLYAEPPGGLDDSLRAAAPRVAEQLLPLILTGMGPVDPMPSSAAKLFASAYALFSGLMFIGVASVLVAPFMHRLIHRFHLQDR